MWTRLLALLFAMAWYSLEPATADEPGDGEPRRQESQATPAARKGGELRRRKIDPAKQADEKSVEDDEETEEEPDANRKAATKSKKAAVKSSGQLPREKKSRQQVKLERLAATISRKLPGKDDDVFVLQTTIVEVHVSPRTDKDTIGFAGGTDKESVVKPVVQVCDGKSAAAMEIAKFQLQQVAPHQTTGVKPVLVKESATIRNYRHYRVQTFQNTQVPVTVIPSAKNWRILRTFPAGPDGLLAAEKFLESSRPAPSAASP